jgi:type IV secretory pathway VirB10-like protein
MAPSYEIGTPQRSLVRIPGSGVDKTLKPICLDVAQISNFSRALSTIINFNFNAPPEQAMSGTLNITPVPPVQQQQPTQSRKRTTEEEERDSRKRPHTSDSSILRNMSLTRQERVEKMKLLKEEEEKLKEENSDLANKVAMFKDILRSRSKLREFLKALDEMSGGTLPRNNNTHVSSTVRVNG